MRHIISILLENQAGALARVASLFSTRGYNIESLNVAPTDNETVSRLTVVTTGSDEVIQQIAKQVGKLVDVVDIKDMTRVDHIERELALFKVRAPESSKARLAKLLQDFGGHVLGYDEGHGTLEIVGNGPEIDRFMDAVADLAEIETVVRSGAMAMARGAPLLDNHTQNHKKEEEEE
jgi:acetolactate synthase-1/3 small subunit